MYFLSESSENVYFLIVPVVRSRYRILSVDAGEVDSAELGVRLYYILSGLLSSGHGSSA